MKESYDEVSLKKAGKMIATIIAYVEMKDQLNLLANLMHKMLEPRAIQNIVMRYGFIPIDWIDDPAAFTDIELPPMEQDKVKQKNRSESRESEKASNEESDSGSSDGEDDKDDKESKDSKSSKEKKPVKQYLYNVPYIFS